MQFKVGPHSIGDIIELEKVQRKVMKLLAKLKDMEYEERCERLRLTALEKRRHQ